MAIVGKKWVILIMIASLTLGFGAGMVADHLIKIRQIQEQILQRQLGYDREFFSKLAKVLNLSQTQAQTIGGLLRLESRRIIQLTKLFRNTMRRIKHETFSRIEEYLTKEQKIRFQEFLKRYVSAE